MQHNAIYLCLIRPFVIQIMIVTTAVVLSSGVATATNRNVISVAGLQAVLNAAEPGDVLRLAPGEYGTLYLAGVYGTDTQPVILTSADPVNPARFRNVMANGAENLVLKNLIFDYRFALNDNVTKLRVSQVNKSRNITILDTLFDGGRVYGKGTPADGLGAGQGLIVRWSRDTRIENSEFRTWYRGMVVSQSRGVVLRGNRFHAIRSDGADFAEVTDVLIENNYFHDFDRDERTGDHADMIQFWTNSTKTPSQNITIRDNVFNSGHGLYTQSIFIRNELVDAKGAGDEMFYRNILITGNVIINAHLHGITVGETDGLTITNNTLIRNPRSAGQGGSQALWTPSIRMTAKSRNVRIERNITPALDIPKTATNWRVENNLILQESSSDSPGFYDNVFVAALLGDPSNLASFTYLPGGPAADGSVGALRLRHTDEQGSPVALVRVMKDPQFVNRFTFDAGLSRTGAKAAIRWDFGDGSDATGQSVTHNFEKPGNYTVTATLMEGRDTSVLAEVPRTDVLALDPETGTFVAYGKNGARALNQSASDQLPDGTYVVHSGQGNDVISINKGALSGFFNAADFALDLRLRAAGTKTPAGEILRIHNNIILSMTPTGSAVFWLNTSETPKPVQISTPPLHLHDGKWHNINLRYNAATGIMSILVNGIERSRKQTSGRIRPMESWGLSFGNPFGKKSFDGYVTGLRLQANTESFAKP